MRSLKTIHSPTAAVAVKTGRVMVLIKEYRICMPLTVDEVSKTATRFWRHDRRWPPVTVGPFFASPGGRREFPSSLPVGLSFPVSRVPMPKNALYPGSNLPLARRCWPTANDLRSSATNSLVVLWCIHDLFSTFQYLLAATVRILKSAIHYVFNGRLCLIVRPNIRVVLFFQVTAIVIILLRVIVIGYAVPKLFWNCFHSLILIHKRQHWNN